MQPIKKKEQLNASKIDDQRSVLSDEVELGGGIDIGGLMPVQNSGAFPTLQSARNRNTRFSMSTEINAGYSRTTSMPNQAIW